MAGDLEVLEMGKVATESGGLAAEALLKQRKRVRLNQLCHNTERPSLTEVDTKHASIRPNRRRRNNHRRSALALSMCFTKYTDARSDADEAAHQGLWVEGWEGGATVGLEVEEEEGVRLFRAWGQSAESLQMDASACG